MHSIKDISEYTINGKHPFKFESTACWRKNDTTFLIEPAGIVYAFTVELYRESGLFWMLNYGVDIVKDSGMENRKQTITRKQLLPYDERVKDFDNYLLNTTMLPNCRLVIEPIEKTQVVKVTVDRIIPVRV